MATRQWAQAAVYEECGEAGSVLRVVSRQLPTELEQDGISVQMLASPVNPSDLNQIEGTYPVKGRFAKELLLRKEEATSEPEQVVAAVGGNEGVGVVRAVGSAVSDLRVGDWVVPRRAGEFGTWCTHTMVRRDQVIGIPEEWRRGVDALTVGSIKVNPSTAYRLLRDFVGLRAGDWVIQNGANSGVGRAVIQLARPMGVHTINVVRDRAEEAEYAGLERELKGLGADIVVRDSDLGSDAFKAQVRALGKHAVRLGLNCVGGRMTLAMTKHLAEGAMLVSYGGMSRQPVVLPTSLLLFKDISARGFWMNRWYEQQQQQQQQQAAEEDEEGVVGERDRMWRDILQLAREGRFVAQPMHKVAWSDELLSLAEAQQLVRGAVDWSSGGKRAFVFG